MATRLFDRYVVVDWSASNSPTTGRDSIWIAELGCGAAGPALTNPSTRAAAERSIRGTQSPDERLLVAVDVSLGFPAGTASRLGVPDVPAWRAWWHEIARRLSDDRSNRSNRFEVAAELNERFDGDGPFWGCPRPVPGVTATKPLFGSISEFRYVEELLRADGRRPSSGWQLFGAGSVGSQTLTLIPMLERWLATGCVEVWPFTTGLAAVTVPPGAVVVAEVWPTVFDVEVPAGWVRDAAQVNAVAEALRSADDTGELARWFRPAVPDEIRRVAELEEGWVLMPR